MTIGKKEIDVKPSKGRVLAGEIISCDMQKTVVVKVLRTFKHPLLGKTINLAKKYKAHDENEVAMLGDWVEISECRPVSKTKHMVLNRVLRKAV